MSLLNILNMIIIKPITILYEIVFSNCYYSLHSAGLAIMVLSLFVNIILLPLFNKSDEIQQKENEIQAKLKDGVKHIKDSFKGDEQYMILNTYYRQNNYNPLYALRSSISLLLEIPFFIAAYNFLANLPLLNKSSFLFIENLGVEDHLLNGINVLPIIMTIINIASILVFSSDKSFKDNFQLYAMAIFFLFFLYKSPSGLVLYWICNNLFSLLKYIFQKLSKYLSITSIFKNKRNNLNKILYKIEYDKNIFIIACIILTILIGLVIPSNVIKASVSEFVDNVTLENPLSL